MKKQETEIKHTPGPWIVITETERTDEDYPHPLGLTPAKKTFVGLRGLTVAQIPDGLESHDANARLIAAAPELLSSCKGLDGMAIEQCDPCGGTGKRRGTGSDACKFCGGVGEIVSGHFHPDELRAIRAAIAKAEGKV